MKSKLCLLLLLTIVFSCGKSNSINNGNMEFNSKNEQTTTMNPSTTTTILPSNSGVVWNKYWSDLIKQKIMTPQFSSILERSINSGDLREIGCPNYNIFSYDEKINFWTHYLATISSIESGYTPSQFKKDKYHDWTYGLFMISSSDANKLVSPITKQKYSNGDIVNIESGIEIALHLLKIQIVDKSSSNNTSLDAKLISFYKDRFFVGDTLRTDKYLFVNLFSNYTNLLRCK